MIEQRSCNSQTKWLVLLCESILPQCILGLFYEQEEVVLSDLTIPNLIEAACDSKRLPGAKKFVKSMRIGAKLSQPWTSHAYTKVAPVDEEESSSNSDHLTTSFVTEIDRKYLEPLASNYQKYQQHIATGYTITPLDNDDYLITIDATNNFFNLMTIFIDIIGHYKKITRLHLNLDTESVQLLIDNMDFFAQTIIHRCFYITHFTLSASQSSDANAVTHCINEQVKRNNFCKALASCDDINLIESLEKNHNLNSIEAITRTWLTTLIKYQEKFSQLSVSRYFNTGENKALLTLYKDWQQVSESTLETLKQLIDKKDAEIERYIRSIDKLVVDITPDIKDKAAYLSNLKLLVKASKIKVTIFFSDKLINTETNSLIDFIQVLPKGSWLTFYGLEHVSSLLTQLNNAVIDNALIRVPEIEEMSDSNYAHILSEIQNKVLIKFYEKSCEVQDYQSTNNTNHLAINLVRDEATHTYYFSKQTQRQYEVQVALDKDVEVAIDQQLEEVTAKESQNEKPKIRPFEGNLDNLIQLETVASEYKAWFIRLCGASGNNPREQELVIWAIEKECFEQLKKFRSQFEAGISIAYLPDGFYLSSYDEKFILCIDRGTKHRESCYKIELRAAYGLRQIYGDYRQLIDANEKQDVETKDELAKMLWYFLGMPSLYNTQFYDEEPNKNHLNQAFFSFFDCNIEPLNLSSANLKALGQLYFINGPEFTKKFLNSLLSIKETLSEQNYKIWRDAVLDKSSNWCSIIDYKILSIHEKILNLSVIGQKCWWSLLNRQNDLERVDFVDRLGHVFFSFHQNFTLSDDEYTKILNYLNSSGVIFDSFLFYSRLKTVLEFCPDSRSAIFNNLGAISQTENGIVYAVLFNNYHHFDVEMQLQRMQSTHMSQSGYHASWSNNEVISNPFVHALRFISQHDIFTLNQINSIKKAHLKCEQINSTELTTFYRFNVLLCLQQNFDEILAHSFTSTFISQFNRLFPDSSDCTQLNLSISVDALIFLQHYLNDELINLICHESLDLRQYRIKQILRLKNIENPTTILDKIQSKKTFELLQVSAPWLDGSIEDIWPADCSKSSEQAYFLNCLMNIDIGQSTYLPDDEKIKTTWAYITQGDDKIALIKQCIQSWQQMGTRIMVANTQAKKLSQQNQSLLENLLKRFEIDNNFNLRLFCNRLKIEGDEQAQIDDFIANLIVLDKEKVPFNNLVYIVLTILEKEINECSLDKINDALKLLLDNKNQRFPYYLLTHILRYCLSQLGEITKNQSLVKSIITSKFSEECQTKLLTFFSVPKQPCDKSYHLINLLFKKAIQVTPAILEHLIQSDNYVQEIEILFYFNPDYEIEAGKALEIIKTYSSCTQILDILIEINSKHDFYVNLILILLNQYDPKALHIFKNYVKRCYVTQFELEKYYSVLLSAEKFIDPKNYFAQINLNEATASNLEINTSESRAIDMSRLLENIVFDPGDLHSFNDDDVHEMVKRYAKLHEYLLKMKGFTGSQLKDLYLSRQPMSVEEQLAVILILIYIDKQILLNQMQIVTLLQIINYETFAGINEIPTGQGKTIILLALNIYLARQGISLIFATSNKILSRRDFEYASRLMEFLTIPQGYIEEQSPPEAYKLANNRLGAINYGVDANHCLNSLSMTSKGQPITRNANEYIIYDEVDGELLDQDYAFNLTETGYNSSNNFDDTAIYQAAYHFYRKRFSVKSEQFHTTDLQSLLDDILQLPDIKKRPFYHDVILCHDSEKQTCALKDLLDNARLAQVLQEGVHYICERHSEIVAGVRQTYRRVVPLINSEPRREISYRCTNSLHTFLNYKAINEGKTPDFKIYPVSSLLFSIKRQAWLKKNYTDNGQLRLIGFTGTLGRREDYHADYAIARYTYFPVDHKNNARISERCIVDKTSYFDKLYVKIENFGSDPILIFCRDNNAVKFFYEKIRSHYQNSSRKILKQSGSDLEYINQLVSDAVEKNTITIVNPSLSRGIDFKPLGKLLVIQTFIAPKRDIKQMAGRTGRKDNPKDTWMIYERESFHEEVSCSNNKSKIKHWAEQQILIRQCTNRMDSQLNNYSEDMLAQLCLHVKEKIDLKLSSKNYSVEVLKQWALFVQSYSAAWNLKDDAQSKEEQWHNFYEKIVSLWSNFCFEYQNYSFDTYFIKQIQSNYTNFSSNSQATFDAIKKQLNNHIEEKAIDMVKPVFMVLQMHQNLGYSNLLWVIERFTIGDRQQLPSLKQLQTPTVYFFSQQQWEEKCERLESFTLLNLIQNDYALFCFKQHQQRHQTFFAIYKEYFQHQAFLESLLPKIYSIKKVAPERLKQFLDWNIEHEIPYEQIQNANWFISFLQLNQQQQEKACIFINKFGIDIMNNFGSAVVETIKNGQAIETCSAEVFPEPTISALIECMQKQADASIDKQLVNKLEQFMRLIPEIHRSSVLRLLSYISLVDLAAALVLIDDSTNLAEAVTILHELAQKIAIIQRKKLNFEWQEVNGLNFKQVKLYFDALLSSELSDQNDKIQLKERIIKSYDDLSNLIEKLSIKNFDTTLKTSVLRFYLKYQSDDLNAQTLFEFIENFTDKEHHSLLEGVLEYAQSIEDLAVGAKLPKLATDLTFDLTLDGYIKRYLRLDKEQRKVIDVLSKQNQNIKTYFNNVLSTDAFDYELLGSFLNYDIGSNEDLASLWVYHRQHAKNDDYNLDDYQQYLKFDLQENLQGYQEYKYFNEIYKQLPASIKNLSTNHDLPYNLFNITAKKAPFYKAFYTLISKHEKNSDLFSLLWNKATDIEIENLEQSLEKILKNVKKMQKIGTSERALTILANTKSRPSVLRETHLTEYEHSSAIQTHYMAFIKKILESQVEGDFQFKIAVVNFFCREILSFGQNIELSLREEPEHNTPLNELQHFSQLEKYASSGFFSRVNSTRISQAHSVISKLKEAESDQDKIEKISESLIEIIIEDKKHCWHKKGHSNLVEHLKNTFVDIAVNVMTYDYTHAKFLEEKINHLITEHVRILKERLPQANQPLIEILNQFQGDDIKNVEPIKNLRQYFSNSTNAVPKHLTYLIKNILEFSAINRLEESPMLKAVNS